MMLSSCISIPGPTHNTPSLNHPKLFSSNLSDQKSRKCKHAAFNSWKPSSLGGTLVSDNSRLISSSKSKIRADAIDRANFETGERNQEMLEAQKKVLRPELMPKHIAVILDGNRRWAANKGLGVEEGHRAGVRTLKEMARVCSEMGVSVVTIFAFSTENWTRPKGEVESLMSLFKEEADEILESLDVLRKYQIRLSVIGNISKFSEYLRKRITTVEMATKDNKGTHLLIALNYGGRQEILGAAKAITRKVKGGEMSVEEINEESFEQELQTSCTEYPSPDLLIRTSGEERISNFLLWQMAYTQLHFVDKCFPDFNEKDFVDALTSFQQQRLRMRP